MVLPNTATAQAPSASRTTTWVGAVAALAVVVGIVALVGAVSATVALVTVAGLAAAGVALALRPDRHREVVLASCALTVVVLGLAALGVDRTPLAAVAGMTAPVALGLALRPPGRRALAEAEAELRARAADLERTKEQLLAVVSHEFRTPVTGVMGVARTMSAHYDGLDDATMRLFVDALEGHSTRLARLVENLVVASGGPLADSESVCDLHAVVTRAAAAVDAGEREIQVSMRGPRMTRMAPDAAQRVVTNLVDNARKFGNPGSPITVAVQPLAGDITLEVTNVGPPLPADLRCRLYEPFAQADSSDSRRADGLGLGLHVVRGLVEAHGGRIELSDGHGQVTFRVRLRPATCVDMAAGAGTDDVTAPRGTGGVDGGSSNGSATADPRQVRNSRIAVDT